MNLQQHIEQATAEFAIKIVAALRGLSIDQLVELTAPSTGGSRAKAIAHAPAATASAPAKRKPGRPAGSGKKSAAGGGGRVRRTADDIAELQKHIVALVKKNADGLRAEDIRKTLGVAKKDITKPIADALAAKLLTKKGEKRATTYFAKK